MKGSPRIIILGAGPTGLGAAWRLAELGYENFAVYEGSGNAGGLAMSFLDEHGFTWDIGGHVQFSHYNYYDAVLNRVLAPEEWLTHERSSWIWMRDRFIPYPLQHNIHRLPADELAECIEGLRSRSDEALTLSTCSFRRWIDATFGEGLAKHFMLPYNEKVWAYPTERMNAAWLGERVARPSLESILDSVKTGKDKISWGPNNTFRFPLEGGTGKIYERIAEHLDLGERLALNRRMVSWSPADKTLSFEDGETVPYDVLINTTQLDTFAAAATDCPAINALSEGFYYSSTNVIGIGLRGRPPEHLATKCWMYFPEANTPFYRVTVFSNYSPRNAPEGCWSLMLEVSESPWKPVDQATVLQDAVQGAIAAKLMEADAEIVSLWHYRADHGYPTPWLERDPLLAKLEAALRPHSVWSRGRFGAWKYEVSNQDHSFMQGVEAVDNILSGEPELTYTRPDHVNSTRTR